MKDRTGSITIDVEPNSELMYFEFGAEYKGHLSAIIPPNIVNCYWIYIPLNVMQRKGRNIVLCFDGTTNRFGNESITNVIRLFEILEKSSDNQLCYYQSGIGTFDINAPSDSQKSSLRSRISKGMNAAFAFGIKKHVLGGYRFLMDKYRQGDIIYMFGFSRGAYTARVLCGMLDKVGLLISGNEEQVAFAWKIYQETAQHMEKDIVTSKNEPLTHGFRYIFGRRVTVHFLGLWDTVQSTGFLRPLHLPEAADGFIEQVYHALALDERRHKFQPLFFKETDRNKADSQEKYRHSKDSTHSDTSRTVLREMWFAGDHSDVGGRFAYNKRSIPSLSNIPFRWIVSAAAMSSPGRGLLFDCHALLEYYDILFQDLPEAYDHYPLPTSAWFCQDYTTVPCSELFDPKKLDFLCIFGHHFLTHHEETISHATDITQDVNRNLSRINAWSCMELMFGRPPSGHARRVQDNPQLHPSVKVIVQTPGLDYKGEIKYKNGKKIKLKDFVESNRETHVTSHHPRLKVDDQRVDASYTAQNADRVIQELENLIQRFQERLMASRQSSNIPLHKQLYTAAIAITQPFAGDSNITMLNFDKTETQLLKGIISLQINLGVWYRIRMESTQSVDDLYRALDIHERSREMLDDFLLKYLKHGFGNKTNGMSQKTEPSGNSEDTEITEQDLRVLQAICMSNYGCLNLALHQYNKDAGALDLALQSYLQAERILKEAGCWSNSVPSSPQSEIVHEKGSGEKFSVNYTSNSAKDTNELQAKLLCNLAETCFRKYETHNSLSFLDHAIEFQEQALEVPDVALRNLPIRQYKLCGYYATRVDHFRKGMSNTGSSGEGLQKNQSQVNEDLHRVSELNREALKSLVASDVDPMQPTRHYSEIIDLLHENYYAMFGNSMARHMDPAIQAKLDRLLGFSNAVSENHNSSSIVTKPVDWGAFTLNIENILALPDVRDDEKQLMTLSNFGTDQHISSFKLGQLLYNQFLRAPLYSKHINDAISQQSSALSQIPRSKDAAGHFLNLGRFYLARIVFRTGDGEDGEDDITAAIKNFEIGLSLANETEENWLGNSELAELFYIRWDRTGNVKDLDDAIDKFKIALKSSNGVENREGCLSRLSDVLVERFEYFGRERDIEAAKALKLLSEQNDSLDKSRLQEVLNVIEGQSPSSSPPVMVSTLQAKLQSTTESTLLTSLHELSHFWLIYFKQNGSTDALNKCISSANDMIQESLTPQGDLGRTDRLVNLGRLLYIRFQRFGNLADLKLAISRCEEATGGVISTPTSDDKRVVNANHHYILGKLYHKKFLKTREISDIDRAISYYEAVSSWIPNGTTLTAKVLNKLGSAYLTRFDLREHSLDDLQKSINAHSRAVALTSSTDTRKQRFLSDLAVSRLRRCLRLLDVAECSEAIANLKEALDLASDDNKLQYTVELALAHLGSFIIQRNTDIIGEATLIIKKVTSHRIPNNRPDILIFYGLLRDLFTVARKTYKDDDTSDSEQADMIVLMKGCMESFFAARASYFAETRYSFSKQPPSELKPLMDIDIKILEQRSHLNFSTDTDNCQLLTELAKDLVNRFNRLEDFADIDEAIMLQRAVLQKATDNHFRKSILGDIGRSYYKRYELAGDPNDLKAAVLAQTDSIHFDADSTSDNRDVLRDLGFSLLLRFESSESKKDINEVIRLRELIVQNCPDDKYERSTYLHDFGYAMFRRYEKFQSLEDISEAITVQREVLQLTTENDPQKSHYNNILLIYEENLLEPETLESEHEVQAAGVSGIVLVGHGEDQKRIRFNPRPKTVSDFISNIRREAQDW